MRSPFVVPADPVPDHSPGVIEILKQMLPDALLFQTPEEAFDHAVLLGSVGGDELLAEPIVPQRSPEAATLEDESVVTPENRSSSLRAQRPETGDAGFLEG